MNFLNKCVKLAINFGRSNNKTYSKATNPISKRPTQLLPDSWRCRRLKGHSVIKVEAYSKYGTTEKL